MPSKRIHFESCIHVYRAMERMTQKDLAEKVGVTRQTILELEKNKINPSLLLAQEIANLFGVPIETIFKFKHQQNKND